MTPVTRLPNQRDLLDALREGRMTTAEWMKLTRLKGVEFQRELERMQVVPAPIRTRSSL